MYCLSLIYLWAAFLTLLCDFEKTFFCKFNTISDEVFLLLLSQFRWYFKEKASGLRFHHSKIIATVVWIHIPKFLQGIRNWKKIKCITNFLVHEQSPHFTDVSSYEMYTILWLPFFQKLGIETLKILLKGACGCGYIKIKSLGLSRYFLAFSTQEKPVWYASMSSHDIFGLNSTAGSVLIHFFTSATHASFSAAITNARTKRPMTSSFDLKKINSGPKN